MYGGALAQLARASNRGAGAGGKPGKPGPSPPTGGSQSRRVPARAQSMRQRGGPPRTTTRGSTAGKDVQGGVHSTSRVRGHSNFGITMGHIEDDYESDGGSSDAATAAAAAISSDSSTDGGGDERRARRHRSRARHHKHHQPAAGHPTNGVLALGQALAGKKPTVAVDKDSPVDRSHRGGVSRPKFRSRSVLDALDSPAGAGSTPDTTAAAAGRVHSSFRTNRKFRDSRRSSDLGPRTSSSRLLDLSDGGSSKELGSSSRLHIMVRKASRLSVQSLGSDEKSTTDAGARIGGGVDEFASDHSLPGAGKSRGSAWRSISPGQEPSRPPHHVADSSSSSSSLSSHSTHSHEAADAYHDLPDSASQWGEGHHRPASMSFLSVEDIQRRQRRASSKSHWWPQLDPVSLAYEHTWTRYYKFVVQARHRYPGGMAPYDTAQLDPEASRCSHWAWHACKWHRHFRHLTYLTLSEPSTGRVPQLFSIMVMVMIMISACVFIVESYPTYRIQTEVDGNPSPVFGIIEAVAVGVFTFEYLARLLTVSANVTTEELVDMNTFTVHMESALVAAVAEEAEERQRKARDAWMAELQQKAMKEAQTRRPSDVGDRPDSPGGKKERASSPAGAPGVDGPHRSADSHHSASAAEDSKAPRSGVETPLRSAPFPSTGGEKGGLNGGLKGGQRGGGGAQLLVRDDSITGLDEGPKPTLSASPAPASSNKAWWEVLPPPPPPVYDRTCCGLCRSDTPGKVWDFLRSPINLIDLLAILPFYIEWALPSTGGVGLTVFRILRLTRIFRIFKLSKYSKGMQMMGRVIMASADAMGLLLFFIAIGVVVFGSIMFFAEAGEYDAATGVYMRTTFTGDGKEPTPFTSIPMAFWYVIVTATTVGYGEMVPTSTVGQLVGVLVMLAGILVLALPITVFGAQFAVEYAAATEEENMEEEEYEYDEYGTPYSPDDRDFPDDGSHVLTPAMLKAASASAGQQAKQKSFAQLDPDVRPRAGDPPGQSVKEMVAKAGVPPVLLQEADAESTSLQPRTMPPEGGQGSWRAVPAVDAIPDDLRTISEDAASSVQSASEVGTGTPAVTAQAAEPLSPQARPAHGPSHTPSLPTSVAGGSRTGASLLTPQSSGKRSIKDLVALMRSHGMQGSASIAPAPSMVSAGPEPSLPGSVQAAGAQAEGGMKRTASVSSAGAGAAGSRRPFASPMPATPLQGAPAAGEGKDLHTVSSRSRGAGVPAPAGAGRGGPAPAGKPTPRVNRARHSIFGAARGGGAAAKADPERDRKNRVTEHILANNPVAKARVTAMRQSGSLTASPAAPAATFSKGTGRSKFQAVAAAALSQASVGGSQALASGVSPAVVAGISEDAAAARRGVEELTSLVRGLMSELKSVRAEVRALRKGTLPTPRGSSSSRHAPFQDGADSDGSSAAPSLVSLPRGERRGAASTTSSHHKPATPVKAVDGVDAVAMDAIGGSASSELDAGTGSAASAHRKRQHGAASSDHVQAMTEAITQRVAASVSAALSQQLEARLAAAGIGPAPQAEP